MSTQLQNLCLSQGLPIYRPTSSRDAIEVIATGDYPTASHWFKIFDKPNGQVGILIEFPSCETAHIDRVEEFCELASECMFGSYGRIYFDTKSRYFYVGGIAEKKTLASHLTCLAYGCDAAIPLCVMVGKQGWWDQASINLALVDSMELFLA